MATGVDSRWTLKVGDQSIPPRPAFGVTTGYDIATAGPATLHYDTSISRALELIAELLMWLLLALGVSRFDTASIIRWRSRRRDAVREAPLLSIDAPLSAPFAVPPDAGALVSLDDSVAWQTQPDTASDEPHQQPDQQPDQVEQHEAGVE